MKTGPEILIVDDNKSFRKGLNLSFTQEGYSVTEAGNGLQALKKLESERFDIVVADIRMPGLDGLELLKKIGELEADCPVITITAHASVDIAVEAMKRGAFDFIEKPFKFQDLELKVKKALEKLSLLREVKKLSRENEYLKSEAESHYDFNNIVGKSKRMLEVYSLIEKIAASNSNVLIYGESGTGKELAARAVHYRSSRNSAPFIKINCSVYPETLLESELFGHEKGAFSGATKSRAGRFEIADGGSIFIDEIGELSPPAQIKLLNVIQEKEFERIGDNRTRKVDVRIIAATNKDLGESVVNKQFREDLYYRLNVISISLPPLRERKEDIPSLVSHFLDKYQSGKNISGKPKITGISENAMDALKEYCWPGNVRELENVIERAIVLADGTLLETRDLPLGIQSNGNDTPVNVKENGNLNLQDKISDYEKEIIERAFRKCNGAISRTAEELGVERNALRYKLKKYGLIMLFFCTLLISFLCAPSFGNDPDSKSVTEKAWSRIMEMKNKINAISERQKIIEKESREKSEQIEGKKQSKSLFPSSTDRDIQSLLKDVRNLSLEYTALQKEKTILISELSDNSERYITAEAFRIKDLAEKMRKIDSNEKSSEWLEYYNEIFKIQSRISEAANLSKSDYGIVQKNIEISIFRGNSQNIDDVSEEIEYIEEGVTLLIESLEKLHSRLEYLYNVKEAKERLNSLTRRLHAGDRLKPSEMINMSNMKKDIKIIEEEIENIKENISLSEMKVKEFKSKYAKLQSIISSYENSGRITDDSESKENIVPAQTAE